MATVLDSPTPRNRAEEKFFFIMACAMSAIIVAGFTVNLALGRSTFAVPVAYHVHAMVFFGWIALYLAQNWSVATGRIALHKTMGGIAYGWAPLMVAMGFVIMTLSMRRTGGPFFFDQNEFLFSNSMLLVLFGTIVIVALRVRRHMGWHRRLMLSAMSILTGPGLGRLLPMPLLMPNAWRIMMLFTLVFPVVGMIVDLRRHGRIHPAWWWGVGAIIAVQVISDILAYSPLGVGITESLLAGTPGAERPMAAFMPPGM